MMLPETITTVPNSPMARANDSSAPAAMAGRIAGSTTAPERGPAVSRRGVGGLLLGRVELEQHRLHGPHHERKRDEQQRQQDPERREDDLDRRGARGTPRAGEFGPVERHAA